MGANSLNGRKEQKTPVLEPELITDSETLEAVTAETTEAPVVTEVPPKREKPNPLILAGLGVGAIVGGTFGYNYWQYTSTHQETDNATVAGNIHIPQLFIIPLIPKLMQRIDVRFMVALGVTLFSISAFMNSGMTHETGLDQLRWLQFVRAMGQPLIMVPLTSIATVGLSPKEAGSASGLFNMMRNMGGSIGIASLATLLTNREQFHSNRLGDGVSLYNPETQQQIEQMTQYFISRGADLTTAQNQAIASISNLVRREAFVMAFNDCFYFIGIALLLSGIAVLFFKKVKPTGGTVAH